MKNPNLVFDPTNGFSGNGGDVTVTNTGNIVLLGKGALGIFAQSVGGGGGLFSDGTKTFAVSMGGKGKAGKVTVIQNGNIYVGGDDGIGSFSQSDTGDGDASDIDLTLNGDVHGGSGSGKGVVVDGGADNVINLLGVVSADSAFAIAATDGNDTFNSYKGVIGNVDLGSGVNAFNNLSGSTFQTLDYVNLGGGLLSNDGVIAPGGIGIVQVTAVNGSLVQSATATMIADLDLHRIGLGGEIDALTVTGAADIKGTFVLNILNPGYVKAGDHTATIIHADGALTASDLILIAPNSAVSSFALDTTAHDENLHYVVDFSPAGLGFNANQTAIGDNINAIQAAGSTDSFAPIAAQLLSISDPAELASFYDSLSSESVLAPVMSTLFAGDVLNNAMLSCRTQDGGTFRFLDEGECNWFQISPRRTERDGSVPGFDSGENLVTVSAGGQMAVAENLRLGVGIGYQNSGLEVGNTLVSSGNRGMAGVSMKFVSDPMLAALTVTGGFGTTDTKRLVAGTVATSRQFTKFASGQFRLATQWANDSFYIRPMLDVAGGAAWLEGFQEQGAGLFNLIVKDMRYTYANVTPAVEIGGEIPVYADSVLRPFVRVGMTQVLTGDKQQIAASLQGAPAGVSPFVTSTRFDRSMATINVGVDLLNAGTVAARVDYSLQLGRRSKSEGVTLKLSTSW